MIFRSVNFNPKQKKTGDCVIRALTKASGYSYLDIYKDLFEIGFYRCEMPNAKSVYEAWLTAHGFVKMKQPRKSDGKKYTVKEFLDSYYKKSSVCVIAVANHLTCGCHEDQGILFDTWDCSYKTVGNYYVKEV